MRLKNGNVRQLKLFPEDRAPETDDGLVVRIRMDRLTVRNVRNWGEVWLALMKAIVLYRFPDPGSELRMQTNRLANAESRAKE